MNPQGQREAATEPHAITRARQRYGLELTQADLDRIRADIAAGRSILTRRDHHRGEVHIVMVNGVGLLAVVDCDNSFVRTVLPPGRYRPASGEASP